MKRTDHFLVFVYYSLKDPLFEGLLFRIITHASRSGRTFDLVTVEQPGYAVADIPAERDRLWNDFGIRWKPVDFVPGQRMNGRKAWMVVRILGLLVGLAFVRRPHYVFTSGSMAASFAWPITALFGIHQVVYAFEPHSTFLVEQGQITDRQWQTRAMRWIEDRVIRGRSFLLTGTHAMCDELRRRGASHEPTWLPTSSDEQLFRFRSEGRVRVRTSIGCGDRFVIAYVGKFGGLYLSEELTSFFGKLYLRRQDLFFHILTPNDADTVRTWMLDAGIPGEAFTIGRCPLPELPDHLSASDAGIVAYAERPSRRFTSPTKSGNYLQCGLPVIVQRDTSEDDSVVEEHTCGHVMPDFSDSAADGCAAWITQWKEQDIDAARTRCRAAGIAYRGLSKAFEVYAPYFT